MKKEKRDEKVQPQKSRWHLSKSSIAIIISILSLIISAGQCYVQRTQIDELLKSDKPKFYLSYDIIDNDDDNYSETEILNITSYGREVSSIKIYTKTFIRLFVGSLYKHSTDIYEKNVYIPINGYFNDELKIKGFEGDITIDSIHNNYYKFRFPFLDKCYTDDMQLRINENLYDISKPRLMKFVIIDYEDTHEKKHKLYFEDDARITEEHYNNIVSQSIAVFHNNVFKIDGLRPKDVIKYIDQDKNKNCININNYSRVYRRQQMYDKITHTLP